MLHDRLTASDDVPTLHSAVQEAIEWEVTLRDGDVSSTVQAQFENWRLADPSHEAAWAKLRSRLGRFSALEGASGAAVRRAVNEPSSTRRRMLKIGAGVAAGVLAGVGTRELIKVFALDADYHNGTAVPERVALNDGVPVTLGASTRIYAPQDQPRGNIFLASGQIATGFRAGPRDWVAVATRDGMVQTRGARLSVDALRRHTVVAVQGGDAILADRRGGRVRATDGTAWSLSSERIKLMPETSGDIFAWTSGTLVVLDRPVPDVVETMGRYFAGYIRFPDSALNRRVSGVFPLDDVKGSLRQLAEGLGLTLNFYGKALAVAV
uniref:Anti-FecI sigma factor, FecR n=1 Tax=Burkholderia sp. (strain CCGE1003) TaxID=640512 RepID=E1TIP9_BURSG